MGNVRVERDAAVAEIESLRGELANTRAGFEKHITALREKLAAHELAAARPATPPRTDTHANHSLEAPVRRQANRAAAMAPVAPATNGSDDDASLQTISVYLGLLSDHPENIEVLDSLGNRLRAFSEQAHSAGHGALHRYSVACRELIRWLRQTPAKVASVLPTLNEAIKLLDALSATNGEVPDPAGALIYAVDDDIDNCECVSAALEKLTLITQYAVKPEVALEELQVTACALIILDVNMPGMDGFEVCAHIRNMEHHQTTPILFVSGLASTKDRLEGLGESEAERTKFIPKPYNLAELSLKAMGMILRRHL